MCFDVEGECQLDSVKVKTEQRDQTIVSVKLTVSVPSCARSSQRILDSADALMRERFFEQLRMSKVSAIV